MVDENVTAIRGPAPLVVVDLRSPRIPHRFDVAPAGCGASFKHDRAAMRDDAPTNGRRRMALTSAGGTERKAGDSIDDAPRCSVVRLADE